jgi:hypothetical protein
MTALSDAIAAHDTATAKLITDLDTLHCDLVALWAAQQAVEALPKADAQEAEATVAVPTVHFVPTMHSRLQDIRGMLIAVSKGRRGSGVADLVTYDWEAEFNAGAAERTPEG